MKTRQWFEATALILLLLPACNFFRSSDVTTQKGTIVEVYVNESFTSAIYAIRGEASATAKIALSGCRGVSGFRKCVLPWSIADPQSGVVFQVKLLGYSDCPLITPWSSMDLRHRCYNTPVIYDFDEQVIILRIDYPLSQSRYELRPANSEDALPLSKRRAQ
ncbi:MAG: hypothetical protein AAB884_00140 [Patescibacteria group bacterium]